MRKQHKSENNNIYYHKFKGINKQHKYYPWTVRGGFKTVDRKRCPLLRFGNSNLRTM